MKEEYYDVVIIGAGLSGIGAAVHISRENPDKSIALIESRDAIGGTWDLFRYPGIRSDSDMFTLGYSFKPWLKNQSIADGELIREYINETADEYGIREKIQFGQRVKYMNWNTREDSWELDVLDNESGEYRQIKAHFVLSCTGYYNYDSGYDPYFPGKDEFKGKLVHPQHWPEDLDYSNKRVVIIGSGATAVTLAPAMSDLAQSVTVLQRSPSYVMNRPKVDTTLERWKSKLSPRNYYRLARAKNISMSFLTHRFCRLFPERAKKIIQDQISDAVGPDIDMAHFSPNYNPWDERLCAVTDDDLFKSIRSGDVEMVTDRIERFCEEGIMLESCQLLEADIIITATGLNLQMFGGMGISVDEEDYDPTKKMCYRDLMLEDLPNMAFIFGYTSASWTLKADIAMKYVCRLMRYMSKNSKKSVVPINSATDLERVPFSDMQSGYMARARNILPLRGSRAPWSLKQNYFVDSLVLRYSKINDGKLIFS